MRNFKTREPATISTLPKAFTIDVGGVSQASNVSVRSGGVRDVLVGSGADMAMGR
jgi:hypothetical protein